MKDVVNPIKKLSINDLGVLYLIKLFFSMFLKNIIL